MKEISDFKKNAMLVAGGIVLFVALMNFKKVLVAIMSVLGLFSPLVVGGMIAFVLNIPMKGIEKQLIKLHDKKPLKILAPTRVYSLLLTYIAFFAILFFIGSVVLPNLAESVKSVAKTIEEQYPVWLDWFRSKGFNVSKVEKYINNLDFQTIAKTFMKNSDWMISIVGGSITKVIGKVGTSCIGFIFSIYILLAKEKLGRQAKMILYAYVKKDWADKCMEVLKMANRIFSNFISGQCLEAVIIGVLFFAALELAKMPYAATIAVVIGSTSLIPIIGAFIGCIFGLLLVVTASTKQAVVFLIIFFVIQQFEGHVIYPNVVGGSVGLPAIWTMLAVIVGGSVAGIGGIILFIPLFSLIYALIRKNVYKRLDV